MGSEPKRALLTGIRENTFRLTGYSVIGGSKAPIDTGPATTQANP